MHVKTHERLGKVLSNLKEVIKQYPSLQSNEILAAAGYLINKVKNNKYEENRVPDDFYQSIDQLALVFSSRYVAEISWLWSYTCSAVAGGRQGVISN